MGTSQSVCDICGASQADHKRFADRSQLSAERERARHVAQDLILEKTCELRTDEGELLFCERSVLVVNRAYDPCDETYVIFEIWIRGGSVIRVAFPLSEGVSKKED